uniref:Uncharacterized protein n=1 Tax=Myotis myotis TaxID=51298 RepID=A0A7J7YDU5_MYOMY|nr:hypothetical protein mMyoMyo1_011012 [Myotis myotis]
MSTCRLGPTPWGIRLKLAFRHPSGSQGALRGCPNKGLGPQGSCDEEAGVTEEPRCPAQLPRVGSHKGRPPPQVADSRPGWRQGRQDGAVLPHRPGWQIAGLDGGGAGGMALTNPTCSMQISQWEA